MKPCWFILLGLALLSACAGLPPTQEVVFPTLTLPTATRAPTEPANAAGLTLEALKNYTYHLKILPGVPVTLVNGQAQMIDPTKKASAQSILMEPVALGDLNGDGTQDAVVSIATNTGGSGTFHELVALLWQNGRLVQVANYELGDRVAERSLKIEAGKISLDYLRHGPQDPFCCPSEHALVTFQLKEGMLQLLDQKIITP